MICSHFFRSQAKLLLVVASIRARARSPRAIRAQHGEALQPFCGALIRTSTLFAAMSTQTVPEAMQSRTNRPSTARTASPTAFR
jgi:urease gamma subunit